MGTKITGFEERLKQLLAGRKFYPWGAALKISTGTLARMAKGFLPTAETLAPISEIEGVSLSWLICGYGNPFNTRPAASAEAMIDDWDWVLEEAHPILVTDGMRATVVAQSERAGCEYIGKTFTRIETWSRFIGRKEAEFLAEHFRDRILLRRMTATDLDALVAGEMGPAKFCAWKAGEFTPWHPAPSEWAMRDVRIEVDRLWPSAALAHEVRDPGPSYRSDAQRINELIDKLTDAERTFVINMLSGLVSPRR